MKSLSLAVCAEGEGERERGRACQQKSREYKYRPILTQSPTLSRSPSVGAKRERALSGARARDPRKSIVAHIVCVVGLYLPSVARGCVKNKMRKAYMYIRVLHVHALLQVYTWPCRRSRAGEPRDCCCCYSLHRLRLLYENGDHLRRPLLHIT